MEWDGANRRQFPRIAYPCLVKMHSKSGHVEPILTHTENIGTGGICVIVKKEIKLFTLVDIEVDLIDESEHIKAVGKVVWSVRRKEMQPVKPLFYDIGIKFENLKDKDHKRLDATIQGLIQKGYKTLKPVY